MIKVNCPTCGVRLTAADELLNKPVNCQKCNTKFILSRRWTSEPLIVSSDGTVTPAVTGEPTFQESLPSDADSALQSPVSLTDAPIEVGGESGPDSGGASGLQPSFDFTLSGTSLDPPPGNGSEDSPTSIRPQSQPGSSTKRTASPFPVPVVVAPGLPEDPKRQFTTSAPSTTDLRHFAEAASVWQFFDFRFRGYLTPGIVRVSWFLILTVFAFWLLFLSYFYLSSIIQRKDLILPTLQNESAEVTVSSDSVLIVPRFFYNSALYFTYTLAALIGLLWVRVLFETVMMVFCIGSHLRDRKQRKS